MTRGACPTLSEPMQTGDGLLVRLMPARGGFTPQQLGGLAEAAFRHGNSILEITARGSLQIRGLETHTVAPLATEIDALGIAVRTGVPVETGPLAGLDPDEIADPRPLAEAIRRALAASDLPGRLGPKVSVVVDGGGRLHLDGIIADVRLAAARIGPEILWQLSIAGTAKTAAFIAALNQHGACEAVVFVLARIAELGRKSRGTDLDPALVRASIARLLRGELNLRAGQSAYGRPPPLTPPHKGEGDFSNAAAVCQSLPAQVADISKGASGVENSPPTCGEGLGVGVDPLISPNALSPSVPKVERSPKERGPVGIFDLANGRAALGVGLPFGQIEASRLAGFCSEAERAGVTEIRLAPGRAALLLAEKSACLDLQGVASRYGLIVDPEDARLGIAACPGSPACASGHIAARALAEQLSALGRGLFDHSLAVHVSGCAKGCACPSPADLTFVGCAEGVALVVGGQASGVAAARLDHAEIRHGFARLAGLYRDKRQAGESANSCFSRLGALRVAAAFQGRS